MLFLQGTRDEFPSVSSSPEYARTLGPRATLHPIEDADHSFKVPKRSGRTPEQVMAELADTIAAWGSAALAI